MTLADEVMEGMYKMYHKSPLCCHRLQETGHALDSSVLEPVKLKGTPWISHRKRALDVVLHNWPALVEHTGQVRQGRTAMRDRAAKLNSTLLRFDVLVFLYLALDLLVIIGRQCRTLQKNTAIIATVLLLKVSKIC